MKKYKINYVSNKKTLSTLYVKSETYPKIPNFDNQKYYILEQLQSQVADLIIIDVILVQRISVENVDVLYNNELIGKSKIIENKASSTIELENKFFSEKYLESELKISNSYEFYGIIPQIGFEIEYVLNKEKTKLFINEEKIYFEHTSGEIYLDEDGKLKGLQPNLGYVISNLELLENNAINFEIKQTGTLHKQEVLNSLKEEFTNEEFIKTNKLLINQLLEQDKKTITKQNLDYFKTQVKQNEKIKELTKSVEDDKEFTKKLELTIDELVEEATKKQDLDIELNTNKNKVKKSLWNKIWKK